VCVDDGANISHSSRMRSKCEGNTVPIIGRRSTPSQTMPSGERAANGQASAVPSLTFCPTDKNCPFANASATGQAEVPLAASRDHGDSVARQRRPSSLTAVLDAGDNSRFLASPSRRRDLEMP
jgi:hypothetical protein